MVTMQTSDHQFGVSATAQFPKHGNCISILYYSQNLHDTFHGLFYTLITFKLFYVYDSVSRDLDGKG